MELKGQIGFPCHRMQKPIQRIDDDDSSLLIVHGPTYLSDEFTRTQLGRVNLPEDKVAACNRSFNLHSD